MKKGFLYNYNRHFLPPRLTIPVKIALPVPFKHTSGPPESPEQTETTARIVQIKVMLNHGLP